MKRISFILVMLLLTACSLPKSASELVGKDRKEAFCHQDDLDATNEKIYGRLALCYNRSSSVPVVVSNSSMSGVLSTIRSSSKVVEKRNGDNEPIYFIVENGIFGMRLALEKGDEESCPTKITAHTMNFFWDKHVNRVKTWLSDPEAGCQFL